MPLTFPPPSAVCAAGEISANKSRQTPPPDACLMIDLLHRAG